MDINKMYLNLNGLWCVLFTQLVLGGGDSVSDGSWVDDVTFTCLLLFGRDGVMVEAVGWGDFLFFMLLSLWCHSLLQSCVEYVNT